MFKPGVQQKGLAERRRRQAVHDELCRVELLRFLRRYRGRHDKPTLKAAADWMNFETGIGPPRGGLWTTKSVHRVALRLGLVITCGRAFGEWPRCPRCDRQMGRWFSDDQCHSCEQRALRIEVHGDARRANLADAKAKLEYYREKVRVLSQGRRFYPPGHSRPTHRFGRPIRGQGKNPK